MSTKKFNSRVPLTVTIDRFRGITPLSPSEKHATKRIVNFRIGEDGSLQKRCGTRHIVTLPQKVRSFWNGDLHGKFHLYVLAGNIVYTVDLKSKTAIEVGSVASSEGTATFFVLQGTLYLTDGGDHVYRIENNRIVSALGYVPLLGKDWDNDNMGEIFEPRNILNRHVRITYVVSAPPSIFLRVPDTIESVEAVYLNGYLLSTDQYRHNKEFNTIDIPGLAADDRVEAHLTFESDPYDLRHRFCTMQGAVFFGSPEKNRTFFFGNEDSDTIFCTEYVTPEQLEAASQHYNADFLYLPEGHEFRVGDGRHPVRGALRHHDNLLIFTEGDTWLGSVDSTGQKRLPTVSVNATLGCLSSYGYALAPNDPITISRHGLYLWQNEHPDVTQCDAIRISQVLDSFLTPDDLKTATLFYDALGDEIWLNLKSRSEIWIRPRTRDEWFCFTGILADRFFDADGQIGFIYGKEISVFDPERSFDSDASGNAKNIVAVYQTPPLSFGTEKMKNLSQITLDTDLGSGLLLLELYFDEKDSLSRTVRDRQKRQHATLATRLRSGRFQNASLRISSSDSMFCTIHSVTLRAH